jgi:hypothetical protein
MKSRRIVTIIVILLIGAVLMVIPASAKISKITVDSYEVYCTYEQVDYWWEGNVAHERGSSQTGFRFNVSEDDPIEIATISTIINSNANHNTDTGTAWGNFVSEPEGFDGTIVGEWNAKIYRLAPGIWPVSQGQAVGYGTGNLKGLRVITEFSSVTDYSGFSPEFWSLVWTKCGSFDIRGISVVHNTYLIH